MEVVRRHLGSLRDRSNIEWRDARCSYRRARVGMTVVLTGAALGLADVIRVAREGQRVELDAGALERMRPSPHVVEAALARGEQVYGFSTGVGMRKLFSIEEDQARFNRMLVRGHLVAQGPTASDEVVRATLLKLANMLARGTSGARAELAERLVAALNDGVTPPVRTLGSVGQADLWPNADLAHGLMDGFELAAGEALVLVDNNAFSTALASLAVGDCETLLDGLEVAGALDLEGFAANLSLLDPAIADARPYPSLETTISPPPPH